jgi:nitronate monooxygenase
VIGTATCVEEARAWARAGADAICAQGIEAGGHRGVFMRPIEGASIGIFALTRLVRAAVDLPVIAAGAIADGEGVAAALMLGADAAQVGTAYLLCEESLIAPAWRRAIETAPDDPTRLTRAFSGRWARGIENAFMREMGPQERDVPAYPAQNALTQELRAASARAGSPDAMSLWAGQAVALARAQRAADLTRDMWAQARVVMQERLDASRRRPLA